MLVQQDESRCSGTEEHLASCESLGGSHLEHAVNLKLQLCCVHLLTLHQLLRLTHIIVQCHDLVGGGLPIILQFCSEHIILIWTLRQMLFQIFLARRQCGMSANTTRRLMSTNSPARNLVFSPTMLSPDTFLPHYNSTLGSFRFLNCTLSSAVFFATTVLKTREDQPEWKSLLHSVLRIIWHILFGTDSKFCVGSTWMASSQQVHVHLFQFVWEIQEVPTWVWGH